MPLYSKMLEYSDSLLPDLTYGLPEIEARLLCGVVGLYTGAGLPVSVKQLFPDTPNSYFRIQCHVKKSAESAIINTRTDLGKEGVTNGLNLQLRIANPVSFDGLDSLSEGIRRQITGAVDCRFCSDKCEGKRYVFSCAGANYTKCQYLCSNFRFTVQSEADINGILRLIQNEIALKKAKKHA